jgi:hypothetical protein
MTKFILFLLALSAIFSACNSNSANGTAGKKDTVVIRDTVSVLSNNSAGHNARREKRYESNTPNSEQANNASNTTGSAGNTAGSASNSTESAGNSTESAGNSSGSANNTPDIATNSPGANQPATNTSQPVSPHKKGWSAAAKDATIGGAAGALGGALLDGNNRLVGGVLGAALGSGAGYLIGRARDRKTGRVVKHQPVSDYNYASQ